MAKHTAILESTKGAWSVSLHLPTGKKQEFHFREAKKDDGHFVCEVPTEVTYVDDFKNTKVFMANFAQHLINSYPHLKLVKVLDPPAVSESAVVKDRPAVVDAKTHAEEIAAGVKAELARIEAEKKAEAEREAEQLKQQRELAAQNLAKARAEKAAAAEKAKATQAKGDS